LCKNKKKDVIPTYSIFQHVRMSSLSDRMNFARVNIGFFTGFKKIKQRRISFVLGYLRMILWKISPEISIKHPLIVVFTKDVFNLFLMLVFISLYILRSSQSTKLTAENKELLNIWKVRRNLSWESKKVNLTYWHLDILPTHV
jgi:hypothetical protein